jgi:hypothetical protein
MGRGIAGMELHQLQELKHWFENFSNSFFDADDFINSHLQLKCDHTWRTCNEIRRLAAAIPLNENQTRIAESIALLHDVGRFPQFARYRTFNDAISVDHGALAVDRIRQDRALESLDAEERNWIETAIAHHGAKLIPEHINGQALLFLRLIRDADKLDIFRIVIERYRDMKINPGGALLELSDSEIVSPEALNAVMTGRPIEYSQLRSVNDFKLCQIGWIYDINFAATFEKLESDNTIEEMFSFLPSTPEIEEFHRRIQSYLEERKSREAGFRR